MRRTPSFLRPWKRFLAGPQSPAERFEVVADDGVRLTIHRVRSSSGQGPAVMLLHGLAANHFGFHFPGRSFAAYLASRGYDCFLPELRGHGESERRGFTWGLDEYLEHDLPVVLKTIQEVSGRAQVHWVGHSMGGILLLCYGILHPEAPIASSIALGSALEYHVGKSGYRDMLRWRSLLERIPFVPYGTLVHLTAPLLGRSLTAQLTSFNVWPSNIEPVMLRRLYGICFHTVPISLLLSLSGVLDAERGLCNRDGTRYREHAHRFRVPLLLACGSRDEQVGPEAVAHTAGMLGGPSAVRVFGRDHGEADEYGHWDLIIGTRAPHEVWPELAAWLDGDARQHG